MSDTVAILGYADRLAVRPGETIAFKVSCETGAATYRADIVRLRCGDDRPDGPGFKETLVKDAAVAGTYPGRQQAIDCGSYILVPPSPLFDALESFTLAALIWPTLPGVGEQTLMAHWQGGANGGDGYSLLLDDTGRLSLLLSSSGLTRGSRTAEGVPAPLDPRVKREGDSVGMWRLSAERALDARRWYRVLGSFDAATRRVVLHYEALDRRWRDPGGETVSETAPIAPTIAHGAPFTIAARLVAAAAPYRRTTAHFNGKIEAPRLVAAALQPDALVALLGTPARLKDPAALVAAWDFARDISGIDARDAAPNRLDGTCVNLPARGVTGHRWAGDSLSWRERPDDYAAIHFHEDDLYDCRWEADFAWTIPAGLRSGIYAARLTTAEGEDRVPFFVLPERSRPGERRQAPVAFLAATATYLAYANSHDAYEDPLGEISHGMLPVLSPTDLFLMVRRDLGLSTYDVHRDGSGCFYSTRLRPILNMRPKGPLWSFNADLHVTDWLDATEQPFDVIDDETLHHEGAALLAGYRCIVTGTHPEYWSSAMLAALRAYLDGGGRLIYLGGNGFYWRIGWHGTLPGAIEVRRGETGTRSWAGAPGEAHLASTGEPSGLWRSSGLAPQALAGVGYVAQGFDAGEPYQRLPGSFDPRVAFIFQGVAPDEPIGDFGAFGGAAAIELDIADLALGTPPHALRLACSGGHSNLYVLTPEELVTNYPGTDGIESPRVRADMVFFETPAGGAVFSTGAIGWAASLAHAGYDNNVARITGNVLRRFLDPTPFAR